MGAILISVAELMEKLPQDYNLTIENNDKLIFMFKLNHRYSNNLIEQITLFMDFKAKNRFLFS